MSRQRVPPQNPLDHIDFDRELIFIDGRDEKQVAWLRERLEEQKKVQKNNQDQKGWGNSSQSNLETRIILTGGKILELQEDIGKTLYFDQAGELTGKFGIKQVPALVIQDGKKLKISEIRI